MSPATVMMVVWHNPAMPPKPFRWHLVLAASGAKTEAICASMTSRESEKEAQHADHARLHAQLLVEAAAATLVAQATMALANWRRFR